MHISNLNYTQEIRSRFSTELRENLQTVDVSIMPVSMLIQSLLVVWKLGGQDPETSKYLQTMIQDTMNLKDKDKIKRNDLGDYQSRT
jgi:hypothetical protein